MSRVKLTPKAVYASRQRKRAALHYAEARLAMTVLEVEWRVRLARNAIRRAEQCAAL